MHRLCPVWGIDAAPARATEERWAKNRTTEATKKEERVKAMGYVPT